MIIQICNVQIYQLYNIDHITRKGGGGGGLPFIATRIHHISQIQNLKGKFNYKKKMFIA